MNEPKQFEGLVIPKIAGTIQGQFCSSAKCHGIQCETCLFDGINEAKFNEWFRQQVASPETVRVPEVIQQVMGADDYLALHRASGIAVGDKVRVVRAATDCENGWHNNWTESMSESVGTVKKVLEDWDCSGLYLENGFWYPCFVLEKIK